MDFMDNIVGLKEIYSETDIPFIATCRPQEMGGHFVGDESQRINHLIQAIDQGARYVDIEIDTEQRYMKQILDRVSKNSGQLIISHHYTEITPSSQGLLDLVTRMTDNSADIIKIVVTPNSVSDCSRILQLYNLEDVDTPLIAFAMGDLGRFTRVSALFLGAPFMYVSPDLGREAAPGQISISEMRAIVRSLS
jgi:3-dehydroquinate dehydratase-1